MIVGSSELSPPHYSLSLLQLPSTTTAPFIQPLEFLTSLGTLFFPAFISALICCTFLFHFNFLHPGGFIFSPSGAAWHLTTAICCLPGVGKVWCAPSTRGGSGVPPSGRSGVLSQGRIQDFRIEGMLQATPTCGRGRFCIGTCYCFSWGGACIRHTLMV